MKLRQIDESALERFVAYMRTKMELNADKPVHWSELDIPTLVAKLDEEVAELKGLLATNAPGIEVLSECADISNFSMFLAFLYKFREAKNAKPESV